MSIGRLLIEATWLLQEEGLDTPRLDAELLLGHALGLTRTQLHAHPDRRLDVAELESYRELIERRRQHEPVAYILGYKEFYGLDFYVDRRVLIPRPETELLVEKGLEIGQAASFPMTIADVGTGCGAVAISLAVHLPQAIIYALDAWSEALEVAALNCRRHSVERRIHLLQGDLLVPLPEPVDLIVANLPYVSGAEWEQLPRTITAYEPRFALHGGPDGLDVIRSLLAQARSYLKPQTTIVLEIGATQGAAVADLARRYFSTATAESVQDYARLDRMVIIEIQADSR
ncbi:MAG: peptide chain release factor N(5)-glutamine methyltransferase [Anaerolineae bacterium]